MKALKEPSAHMLYSTLPPYVTSGMLVCMHFGKVPGFLLLLCRANVIVKFDKLLDVICVVKYQLYSSILNYTYLKQISKFQNALVQCI